MAFPEDRLQMKAELAFGADPSGDPSAWTFTAASDDVLNQTVTIARGRANETSQVQPMSASLELDNPDGDYTPDYPEGAHYPDVQIGTPIRFWAQAGGPHLLVPDLSGARTRVASSSDLDFTDDLDVRIELALDRLPAQSGASSTRPYAHTATEVIARFNATGTNRMWRLVMTSSGAPEIGWSTDGSDTLTVPATDAVPYISGQRFAMRATLDVDNGASGHTATFYTAASLDGPWTQLGEEVVTAGTTTINQTGDASLEIGDVNTLLFARGAGRYYGAQLRDGIDGTLLASPDFTAQTVGITSFTDAEGNLWQLQGGCEITDYVRRAVGTVDEWLPSWPYGDLSDEDQDYQGEARVQLAISGILRRLGQGDDPLQSTLRRRIPSDPDLLAYWPMEEGQDATQAFSPIMGVRPMLTSGLSFAADDSLPGSDALPTVSTGSRITGSVPLGTGGGWHVELVYNLAALPPSTVTMLQVHVTGSAIARALVRPSASAIRIELRDDTDAVVAFFENTGADALAAFTGDWCRLQIFTQDDGADTIVYAQWIKINTDQTYFAGATFTGDPGNVSLVTTASVSSDFDGMSIGHIAAFDSTQTTIYNSADHGFSGERAIARLRRLAEEEQLPLSVLGTASESELMGPQRPAKILDLLQECATVDGGILTERREVAGLQYRPRYLIYNQTPALILDAASNEIINPFQPVLDDQRIRNDITVSRTGGSSARAVDEASIARSGRYKDPVTVNASTDGQLPDIASWRLHLGTWPGMRYPSVSAELSIATQLITDWLNVDSGSRIQIINLPPQHPTDTVDLIVEQPTETLSPTHWTVRAACSPAGPWSYIGVVDGATSRADTSGSELTSDITSTATAISVATTAGPIWADSATYPTDYPLDLMVGGERVTATACTPSVQDAFGRSVSNSWGSADVGGSWTNSGGAAANFDVNGSAGTHTLTSVATPHFSAITAPHADFDIYADVATSQLATGGPIEAGPMGRFTNANNLYQARLSFATSQVITLQIVEVVGGVGAVLASFTTSLTHVAGTFYRLRFQGIGTALRAKAWATTSAEPDGWQLAITDASLTAAGSVGCRSRLDGANTNVNPVISYDNFELVNPQTFTATRSVNGVTKAHAAGTAVALADPVYVAL